MNRPNIEPSPETSGVRNHLFLERERRLQAAFQLKQPDRIPIILHLGYMPAEMGGITKQEFLENQEKAEALLEKAALEFQPESAAGPIPSDPRPYLQLGDRKALFPGHGLDPNSEYQFVEKEFMKSEEYDQFLEDPSDWAMRTYLPRVYSQAEGFSLLPPLGALFFGSVLSLASLSAPPIMASFEAFSKTIQISAEVVAQLRGSSRRMAGLGFVPPFTSTSIFCLAPFDFISENLRGMRGSMLDMFQRPQKLLAAEEKVSRFQLENAIRTSRARGIKTCFMALHRGSDGFMSLDQFEKFYWPQFKKTVLVLVDNGIRPIVFYEGAWDQRLKYLTELPRGRTAGWFQKSDIFKVKEILGETMCIMGGMPNSLLVSGTVEDVRAHTQRVCQTVGKGGGFIMSTCVGEMSGSRPQLVKAWVEATRQYGTY